MRKYSNQKQKGKEWKIKNVLINIEDKMEKYIFIMHIFLFKYGKNFPMILTSHICIIAKVIKRYESRLKEVQKQQTW